MNRPETCYWDPEENKLQGNTGSKVRQFLREGLIKPGVVGEFFVHPAKGRHLVHKVNLNEGTCTCQYYKIKHENCSHILACKLFMYQVVRGERRIDKK